VLPVRCIAEQNWNRVYKFLEFYYLTGKTIKWIVEEPLWTYPQISFIINAIGNHYISNGFLNKVFIKSNTGFVPRLQNRDIFKVIEDFPSLVRSASPSSFGVKISGGISTLNEVYSIVESGCVVGTSKGCELSLELDSQAPIDTNRSIREEDQDGGKQ
jgi:deoxyribose-phosphate aldolase